MFDARDRERREEQRLADGNRNWVFFLQGIILGLWVGQMYNRALSGARGLSGTDFFAVGLIISLRGAATAVGIDINGPFSFKDNAITSVGLIVGVAAANLPVPFDALFAQPQPPGATPTQ